MEPQDEKTPSPRHRIQHTALVCLAAVAITGLLVGAYAADSLREMMLIKYSQDHPEVMQAFTAGYRSGCVVVIVTNETAANLTGQGGGGGGGFVAGQGNYSPMEGPRWSCCLGDNGTATVSTTNCGREPTP